MSNETNSPNGDSKKMRKEIPIVETDEGIPYNFTSICFYMGKDNIKDKNLNLHDSDIGLQIQNEEYKKIIISVPPQNETAHISLKEENEKNSSSKNTKTER